jgi:replicative superfamily II helicase
MVFVHSRKDTVKTARALADWAAKADGDLQLFDCREHPQYAMAKKDVGKSR